MIPGYDGPTRSRVLPGVEDGAQARLESQEEAVKQVLRHNLSVIQGHQPGGPGLPREQHDVVPQLISSAAASDATPVAVTTREGDRGLLGRTPRPPFPPPRDDRRPNRAILTYAGVSGGVIPEGGQGGRVRRASGRGAGMHGVRGVPRETEGS